MQIQTAKFVSFTKICENLTNYESALLQNYLSDNCDYSWGCNNRTLIPLTKIIKILNTNDRFTIDVKLYSERELMTLPDLENLYVDLEN